MLSFIDRIFGKNSNSPKSIARDRLRAVILFDRADIPAPMLEEIQKEIYKVLSRYVEVDEAELNVGLEREDGMIALVANIPIRRVKAESEG